MEWAQTRTSNLADCDIGTLADNFTPSRTYFENAMRAQIPHKRTRGVVDNRSYERDSKSQTSTIETTTASIPPYGDRVDGPFNSLSNPDGSSQRTSISCEDSCRDIMSSRRVL